MINYTAAEDKAWIECYTLEDLLQETLLLGAKDYKLCLENDYFCFNRGGNYTAYFDAPAGLNIRLQDIQEPAEAPVSTSEHVIKLSEVDSEAFVAAMLGELSPEEEDSTPSDVNTAASPEAAPAEAIQEEAPAAPRRGRPPRATT